MTENATIVGLDAHVETLKERNTELIETINSFSRDLQKLRELNADLISALKLTFSYVYLTEDDENRIRALIARAEKLK